MLLHTSLRGWLASRLLLVISVSLTLWSCSQSSHLGACVYFLVNLNNGDKMKPGPFMAVVAAAAWPLVETHGSWTELRTSL